MITTTIQNYVDWLAQFGETAERGVTRLLYTPAWQEAQQALQQRMKELQLTVNMDAVGNVFARSEGTVYPEEVILTGSHIDTVINGGKLDGAYGVLASLLAVSELKRQYGAPKRTLEVVSLCEEEGSRFPLTFWGSRSITGQYKLAQMQNITDADDVSLASARQACGVTEGQDAQRKDIVRFVELHIEQGQVLEQEQKEIGVVSYIVGQRRYTISIGGQSNHAGTTPMHYRKDALVIAAQCISLCADAANEVGDGFVATTGQITAFPNVPNVIANDVKFTLDVRHYDEATIAMFCEKIFFNMEQLAKNVGATIIFEQWLEVAPVAMDKQVNDQLKLYLQQQHIPYKEMLSGAGHDAQVFGEHVPTTLIFVPSKDGISHSPQEYSTPEHLQRGVEVLTHILYELAYKE